MVRNLRFKVQIDEEGQEVDQENVTVVGNVLVEVPGLKMHDVVRVGDEQVAPNRCLSSRAL